MNDIAKDSNHSYYEESDESFDHQDDSEIDSEEESVDISNEEDNVDYFGENQKILQKSSLKPTKTGINIDQGSEKKKGSN